MFSRASRSRARAHRAARVINQQPLRVANEEVRILIGTVEDLIERAATAADPELTRLRAQTEAALAGAKAALADGSAQVRDQAVEFAKQGKDYLRERPLTAVGLAALCVLAIGLWAGRALTD